MFNRVTAAIITATISFSATSAFAVNDRIHLITSCAAYNDRGVRVIVLRPGYYPIIKPIRFRDGDHGTQIWSREDKTGRLRAVNVSNRCVESYGRTTIRY